MGDDLVTININGQIDLISECISVLPKNARIIDIGTGSGLAANNFYDAGFEVVASGFDVAEYWSETNRLNPDIPLLEDLDVTDMQTIPSDRFDAVWCAHVLEHVSNTEQALSEILRILKPGGKLFISVPPFKHAVVGGHVNIGWNIGTLMYVLADAGFDLHEGRFVQHGYNIFGIAEKGPKKLDTKGLKRANGDIEILHSQKRFPKGFDASQNFNGAVTSVNWKWNVEPESVKVWRGALRCNHNPARLKMGFFIPWITQSMGGTENVGHLMANAMAERGHDVTIFTFDSKNQPSHWPLHASITLVHLPEEESDLIDANIQIEIISRDLDLLVGLHMNRTFLRYIKWSQKAGLPFVASEHIDPRFPDWIGRFPEAERIVAFTGATLVHLLLEEFKSTLPDYLHGKLEAIPNTVKEPKKLASLEGEKQKYRVLAVSRLVERKQNSTLIKAFSQVSQEFDHWELCILGDGPELKNLQNLSNELGVANKVTFAGHSSDPYSYYQNADIFAFPSIFEGFPLTLSEALAHGLPAVAFSACSGAAAQIVNSHNGFLCASVDEMVAKLQLLMGNHNMRVDMGHNAREHWLQKFSNEKVFDAWEEMFIKAYTLGPENIDISPENIAKARLHEKIWGEKNINSRTRQQF